MEQEDKKEEVCREQIQEKAAEEITTEVTQQSDITMSRYVLNLNLINHHKNGT